MSSLRKGTQKSFVPFGVSMRWFSVIKVCIGVDVKRGVATTRT
jgi:hypothetical protein